MIIKSDVYYIYNTPIYIVHFHTSVHIYRFCIDLVNTNVLHLFFWW